MLTPVAWVLYAQPTKGKQDIIIQRELLVFGIRMFVKTVGTTN